MTPRPLAARDDKEIAMAGRTDSSRQEGRLSRWFNQLDIADGDATTALAAEAALGQLDLEVAGVVVDRDAREQGHSYLRFDLSNLPRGLTAAGRQKRRGKAAGRGSIRT